MIYRTALPLPETPKMVLQEIPCSTTYTTNECCRDSIQHLFAFWKPAGALAWLMRGFVAKLPRKLISIVSWFFTMLCYESVSNLHSWNREHISLLLVARHVNGDENAPTVPSVLLHDDKLRVFLYMSPVLSQRNNIHKCPTELQYSRLCVVPYKNGVGL